LIPVTLMLFAAMLMFKGSKQSSDEKAQAFQAQRSQQGVAEGNIWHGTDSGSDEADNTDHNFEEATQYIKGAYPFHKTYNVYRAEPGFRALFNPGHFLKGIAHTEKVDSGLDQLQLKRNPMMSGDAQVSASIGYSWSVLENASTGIALLYYQDRGMGSDQIIIAAKDKQQLAGALGVFRDAGVIPDPSEMAARKAEKAAGRTAILQKKGLVVGVKFSASPGDGSNMYKITAITPSGKVKAMNLDTGQVRLWSPGSISKGMLQTGLYPDEFDEPRQGVAEGLPQILRKVVPGYAKREIDKKMDAEKFGRTDVDRDANYYRYKKIQDKLKEQGVAEGLGSSSPTRVMRKYLPNDMWDSILSHSGKSKHDNADGSKTSNVWRLRNLTRSWQGQEFDAWKQAVEQELGSDYQVTSKWPTPSVRHIQMNDISAQQGVAEGRMDEGAVDKLKELYQSLVSKVRTIPNFKQYYDAAKLKRQEVVDAIKTSKNAEELKQKIAAITGSAPVMEEFDPPPATASVTALAVGLFETWAAQVVGVYSQMAVGTGADIVGGLMYGVVGQVGCIGLALYYAIKANQLGKRNQDVAEGSDNKELYGLKLGDVVKARVDDSIVQGNVIDLFPETMEVELLLRGDMAGRTVTVDVRDTEYMDESGVAEERKVTKNEKGDVTGWSDETPWQKANPNKQKSGKAANLAGKALKQTQKMADEEPKISESKATINDKMFTDTLAMLKKYSGI